MSIETLEGINVMERADTVTDLNSSSDTGSVEIVNGKRQRRRRMGVSRPQQQKHQRQEEASKGIDLEKLLDLQTLMIIQAAVFLGHYQSLQDFTVCAVRREAERFADKHAAKENGNSK